MSCQKLETFTKWHINWMIFLFFLGMYFIIQLLSSPEDTAASYNATWSDGGKFCCCLDGCLVFLSFLSLGGRICAPPTRAEIRAEETLHKYADWHLTTVRNDVCNFIQLKVSLHETRVVWLTWPSTKLFLAKLICKWQSLACHPYVCINMYIHTYLTAAWNNIRPAYAIPHKICASDTLRSFLEMEVNRTENSFLTSFTKLILLPFGVYIGRDAGEATKMIGFH